MKHASLIKKIGTIRSVSEGTKSEQDSGLLRNHNRKRMLRVVNVKIKKILGRLLETKQWLGKLKETCEYQDKLMEIKEGLRRPRETCRDQGRLIETWKIR